MTAPGKPPPGANPPRKPIAPAKPAKRPKGAEGIDVGDSVYVRHSKRGAIAVSVSAVGKDGFTARCDKGERHRCAWGSYLGHRARMLHRYELVEQGADGALVRDGSGRQRFVAGLELPEPEEERAAANAVAHDDPILGGLDRLGKAEVSPVLMILKAQPVPPPAGGKPKPRRGQGQQGAAQGPGQEEQAHDAQPARKPLRHGDVVKFRHGDVEGQGKIVASGKDGVTVHDGEREHQVRHDALIHPDDEKPGAQQQGAPEKEGAAPAAGPPASTPGQQGHPPADSMEARATALARALIVFLKPEQAQQQRQQQP
ncbi:conserved protein of unknown function (plasmid) [Rhodovastum atsumiense]|uniref:Uncharacterized protein n=1 Tax=Rhodovastum atsumiense TaxID=504468 RepID=A0A5M6IUW6_9PROT|nr:hypothetical protein [Rhodovastum atsumiense]KAA5611657.1 hypothetical protein F1189_13940 [Rhodovastum atsumiense]CAH2606243.1 conserved protein of unknown function [Rhodovastum atsumiense]